MVKLAPGSWRNRLMRQSGSQEQLAALLRMACPHAGTQSFDPDVRLKQRGSSHMSFRFLASLPFKGIPRRSRTECRSVDIHDTEIAWAENQQKRKSITFAQNSSLALTGTAVR